MKKNFSNVLFILMAVFFGLQSCQDNDENMPRVNHVDNTKMYPVDLAFTTDVTNTKSLNLTATDGKDDKKTIKVEHDWSQFNPSNVVVVVYGKKDGTQKDFQKVYKLSAEEKQFTVSRNTDKHVSPKIGFSFTIMIPTPNVEDYNIKCLVSDGDGVTFVEGTGSTPSLKIDSKPQRLDQTGSLNSSLWVSNEESLSSIVKAKQSESTTRSATTTNKVVHMAPYGTIVLTNLKNGLDKPATVNKVKITSNVFATTASLSLDAKDFLKPSGYPSYTDINIDFPGEKLEPNAYGNSAYGVWVLPLGDFNFDVSFEMLDAKNNIVGVHYIKNKQDFKKNYDGKTVTLKAIIEDKAKLDVEKPYITDWDILNKEDYKYLYGGKEGAGTKDALEKVTDPGFYCELYEGGKVMYQKIDENGKPEGVATELQPTKDDVLGDAKYYALKRETDKNVKYRVYVYKAKHIFPKVMYINNPTLKGDPSKDEPMKPITFDNLGNLLSSYAFTYFSDSAPLSPESFKFKIPFVWSSYDNGLVKVVDFGDTKWTSMRGMFAFVINHIDTEKIDKAYQAKGLMGDLDAKLKYDNFFPDNSYPDLSLTNDMSYTFFMSPVIFLDSMDKRNKSVSKWNTSKVTNMDGIFSLSTYIPDLNHWDVSKVTSMKYAFACYQLEPKLYGANKFGYLKDRVNTDESLGEGYLPEIISSWDVSNVQDMSYMFVYSTFAENPANHKSIDNWNVSNVTKMDYMFADAFYSGDDPNVKDFTKWNVEKVTSYEKFFTTMTYLYDDNQSDHVPAKFKAKVAEELGE